MSMMLDAPSGSLVPAGWRDDALHRAGARAIVEQRDAAGALTGKLVDPPVTKKAYAKAVKEIEAQTA